MKSLNSNNGGDDNASCLACGCYRQQFVGNKNQLPLWQCLGCGVILMRAQAERKALDILYNHYYDYANFEIPSVVTQSLVRQVDYFAEFRTTGRMLDIGFGEGGLLHIAEQRGWHCFGTEVSPQALAYGVARGWTVTNNGSDDPRFVPQSFDVVTMIELLEHLSDPQQMLKSAAKWLRPGGLLYLTTPNAKSLNWRVLGLDWSVVCPPEHMLLWTAKAIRQTLVKFGLQPLRVRTEGLNPYEMLARLRPPQVPFNRNQTGVALNQAFSSSSSRRALKTSINFVLSTLQVGDSLKVYAIRI